MSNEAMIWATWAKNHGGSESSTWGSITGSIDNQTDLKTKLDSKQDTIPANTYDTYGTANTEVSTHNSAAAAHSSLFAAKQDILTAGTGIKIENNTISVDSISGIAIYDNRIDDANQWLTNGYTKTHSTSEEYETATLNLPAICTGSDRWGVLLYVAENNENKAGLQQYFPIDGTYKGRIFFRSVTGWGAGIDPDFGEWNLVPWETEKENKGKITINNTEYSVRTSTTDAGTTGYITFVVSE